MENKVFISKGSEATTEQKEFVDAIVYMLKTVGLSPRIMNENEWSHEQPLKGIKKVISECNGAVIIAFTRTSFDNGVEIKKDFSNQLTKILLPTTWNHIEGAIAYSFNMPLLVIAENGLKVEGLIEDGYDWRVYWTNLTPEIIKTDSFHGFRLSWKTAVDQFSLSKKKNESDPFNPDKLPIGMIIRSLTISQIWQVGSAILAFLISISSIAYKLGAGKWPWD